MDNLCGNNLLGRMVEVQTLQALMVQKQTLAAAMIVDRWAIPKLQPSIVGKVKK